MYQSIKVSMDICPIEFESCFAIVLICIVFAFITLDIRSFGLKHEKKKQTNERKIQITLRYKSERYVK